MLPWHSSPQVVGGGDGLQIWRVAANILTKQSRTADRGWSSSLGVGQGLTTPTVKRLICYKMLQRASDQKNGCEIWNVDC
jgi:hypothetical protein